MSDASKLESLAACIKQWQREVRELERRSQAAAPMGPAKKMGLLGEHAAATARQIAHLKHEAHCLCVELGLADLRADSHYGEQRVGAYGLGKEILIVRRRPNIGGSS
jgi:hypothetical protein